VKLFITLLFYIEVGAIISTLTTKVVKVTIQRDISLNKSVAPFIISSVCWNCLFPKIFKMFLISRMNLNLKFPMLITIYCNVLRLQTYLKVDRIINAKLWQRNRNGFLSHLANQLIDDAGLQFGFQLV
jgi:hypothetical protein